MGSGFTTVSATRTILRLHSQRVNPSALTLSNSQKNASTTVGVDDFGLRKSHFKIMKDCGFVQMRARKPRLRLAGIWMSSRATEDGVKGRVTEKIFFVSIINVVDSTLSFRRF
ncbi:hypothetical protein EYF80_002827 [Liparis tanakae]|uniref:Uncharacterized protein n=1 Tax=Liparis tanakae TaxID=230148 RepID=A0A4Z2JCN7_9TELE|nr:hypothetical protein EYF80_002827 [Liparis tanakae]